MSLASDVTVLRADPSVSGSGGRGAGTATAPRVLKQRFVLDEKLGSGGMGTVFRAKDLRKVEARDRNPYVAVKVLNNDFREHPEAFIALQREAAKSQALSHRNIVSIYDFDKDGDVPFIIMELLEGQELADLLRAYPTGMPDEMAWKIIRCLCDGLEHAHEAGLVHADFKPGNVFVSPSNTAKILDFGIARAVTLNLAGEPADDGPQPPAALTPAYASAEMLDREDPEIRDDLFSLGVVVYLMLTGTHPYGRVPANEAREQGLQPERPRRLSRRQWRILARCLAFRRQDRPASVAAVRQGLFEPSPWRSRTALIAAAAVLVTLAASAFKEEAAVQEATVTVRQTTLVDAQVARVDALLGSGRAEPAWEAAVAEEVAVLRALLPAGAPDPDVLGRVRARYQALIAAEPDRDAAIALLYRGRAFGPLPEADAYLRTRLTADVEQLLDSATLTLDWMTALESALARLAGVYPEASGLATLRLETVNVLGALLDQSLAADRFPAARQGLRLLEAHGFDAELLGDMQERVARAERQYLSRQTAQARNDARQRFVSELEGTLEGACLRFEPEPAAAVFRRWISRYPAFAAAGRDRVAAHVARCAAQVEALDRQRAADLRQRSVAAFGPLPGVAGGRDDPCAADYLLGNGSQLGRGGTCADR
ncbi:MAG: serine/threonine-protein kinase, partial [Pseudomonadales bacterium]